MAFGYCGTCLDDQVQEVTVGDGQPAEFQRVVRDMRGYVCCRNVRVFPKMYRTQAFWAVWSAKVLVLFMCMKTMEQ